MASDRARDPALQAPAPRRRPRRRIRRAARGLALAGIVLLYALSIPWYRDPDAAVRIVFGLPDWTAIALGCYVAAALLNAAAWLLAEIPEDSGEERLR